MIWLTWRQFRASSVIAAAALVIAAVALAVMGSSLAQVWSSTGAGACPATGDCAALESFLSQVRSSWTSAVYILATALIFLVPPLVGVFWGAPLVARELEAGTQRLVWSQSVTRGRWLATKLAVVGGAGMLLAGLLSLAATWSSQRLDGAGLGRLHPALFEARGLVPVAYAAFAFTLGVVVGMVLRRSVPAMAATLAIYTGSVLAVALGVRSHLFPVKHVVQPLVLGETPELMIHNGGRVDVVADFTAPGSWVVHNDTITPAGQVFHGPADPAACNREAPPRACEHWIQSIGLRQRVDYHPASHFWPLQLTESALFLALTVALVVFAFWWLRRRAT